MERERQLILFDSRATDLEEERTRLLKLDRQARVEQLEKLVLELEREPAKTTESVVDQGNEENPNQADGTEEDGETVPVKDTSIDHAVTTTEDLPAPKVTSPIPEGVMSEASKQKAARLALYRDLLSSTTEVSHDDTPIPPENGDANAAGTPKSVSPGPDPVSSDAPVDPISAGKPDVPVVDENPTVDATLASGDGHDNSDSGHKSPPADAQLTAKSTEQPTNSEEQAPQVVEEPIVVKAEPVDIDITAIINAAGSEGLQSGEAAVPEQTSDQIPEDSHVSLPADISMEEDPLLAELFPTFPMGNSPMQAHQTQTEEEADPLLAGMLQEVSIEVDIVTLYSSDPSWTHLTGMMG